LRRSLRSAGLPEIDLQPSSSIDPLAVPADSTFDLRRLLHPSAVPAINL
jgi:hypothetical protein